MLWLLRVIVVLASIIGACVILGIIMLCVATVIKLAWGLL